MDFIQIEKLATDRYRASHVTVADDDVQQYQNVGSSTRGPFESILSDITEMGITRPGELNLMEIFGGDDLSIWTVGVSEFRFKTSIDCEQVFEGPLDSLKEYLGNQVRLCGQYTGWPTDKEMDTEPVEDTLRGRQDLQSLKNVATEGYLAAMDAFRVFAKGNPDNESLLDMMRKTVASADLYDLLYSNMSGSLLTHISLYADPFETVADKLYFYRDITRESYRNMLETEISACIDPLDELQEGPGKYEDEVPTEDEQRIREMFMARITEGYEFYMGVAEKLNPGVGVVHAPVIEATRQAYEVLRDGRYSADDMEYMLRFENPLEVLRDRWMAYNISSPTAKMEDILHSVATSREAEQVYGLDEDFLEGNLDEGQRM